MKTEFSPTEDELKRRDQVRINLVGAIRANEVIPVPPYCPPLMGGVGFPTLALGLHLKFLENPFAGWVGEFRYQFEGEEDLLHLTVDRIDGLELTVEDGQRVAAFMFPTLEPGLVWIKPGRFSQHFYVGHDELLKLR